MTRKIESKYSVGWELEVIQGAHYVPQGIKIIHDGSVGGESLEYVLEPEHVNDIPLGLQKLRRLVSDKYIMVDTSCGFHVHISPNHLSKEKSKAWAGWMLTLARMTEDEAFEAVPESRNDNSMCRRLKHTDHSIQNRGYSRSKYSNEDRYYWMNVVEMMRPGGIKTVEIRLLGNTHRFIWLQAWVAMSLFMAKIASDLLEDPSSLHYRVNEINERFKRMQVFKKPKPTTKRLKKSDKENILLSHRLAQNMDLEFKEVLRPNRLHLITSIKLLAHGSYTRCTSEEPTYTREEVDNAMDQEMENAKREYERYQHHWEHAIEWNNHLIDRKRRGETDDTPLNVDNITVTSSQETAEMRPNQVTHEDIASLMEEEQDRQRIIYMNEQISVVNGSSPVISSGPSIYYLDEGLNEAEDDDE